MTKPINFSYSNTLISSQQKPVLVKGDVTHNNGNIVFLNSASSSGIMGGMSRPSVNVGHAPGTDADTNYNHAKNYVGTTGQACVGHPFPMKHWRRQLNVNGKSGRSAASVDVANRPGGTVFRGYKLDNTCACDENGNNLYVTFDNKFLQSNNKSIKPPANIPNASGTTNNKIQNNGSVQVGGIYQIQTGIYNTKTICCTPENNVIKSAVTLLSKSYYSDNRAYLKSRCKLYNQKQSVNDISGNNYIDSQGNPIPPSNSSTGSQNYRTNNCAWPYQKGIGNACTKVIYKPSNAQYATQGAVDNGTRLAKLKYDTITKNGASFKTAFGEAAANAGKYHGDYNGASSYFLKSKYQRPLTYRRNGNKLVCSQGKANCGPGSTLPAFWGSIN
jgi:hypothetical protein